MVKLILAVTKNVFCANHVIITLLGNHADKVSLELENIVNHTLQLSSLIFCKLIQQLLWKIDEQPHDITRKNLKLEIRPELASTQLIGTKIVGRKFSDFFDLHL